MAGTCGCGNEPSGFIECGEFLDWLRTGYFLKKDCAALSRYVCMYVSMYVCMYVCVYVCVYVCMCL